MRKLSKGRGRPLKGASKRVRLSFTLDPADANWLSQEAKQIELSKSELLERLIEQYRSNSVDIESEAQVFIPYDEIEKFCKASGIKSLSLFGSVIREDFNAESDIDILVEFSKKANPSFFDLAKMQIELEEIFDGREVDLKTEKELSSYFRQQVKESALKIYES